MSYNYPNVVIDNQNYNTCFRQEQGFCSIDFSQTPTTGIDTFDLYSNIENMNAQTQAKVSITIVCTLPVLQSNLLILVYRLHPNLPPNSNHPTHHYLHVLWWSPQHHS